MPELAVLSAIVHGQEKQGAAAALAALGVCSQLDNHLSDLYADLVWAYLSPVALQFLEILMAEQQHAYQSDFANKYYDEGREEGMRNLLRAQLERRFGTLSPALVDKLERADAATLARWGTNIVDAASADAVLAV